MFKRFATLDIESVLKNEESFSDWKNLVKKANGIGKTNRSFLPPGTFTYKPEQFLYFTARSISGDTPNRNGDFFPWKELEASYETFVGKGMYVEHLENSCEDARGLVLDSVTHPDEKFIECLAAIDKKLYPEICGQITSGIINSVSMSCNCEEAECSECGNIAHNAAELCNHTRQYDDSEQKIANVNYCKGRLSPSGKTASVYEINRGVVFTGLSLVSIPADPTANIFEVFAALKNDLEKHLFDYKVAKMDKKNKEIIRKAMDKLSKGDIKILAEIAKQAVDEEPKEGEEVNVKEKAKEIKKEVEAGPKLQTMIDEAGEKVVDSVMKSVIKEVIEEKTERIIEPQKLMLEKVVAPKVEEKMNQVIPQIEQAIKEMVGGTPVTASTTITVTTDEKVNTELPAPPPEVSIANEFKEGDIVIMKDAQKRTPAGSKVKVLKKLDAQEQKLTYKDYEVVSDSGEVMGVTKDDIIISASLNKKAVKVETAENNISWGIYVTPTKGEKIEDIVELLENNEDLHYFLEDGANIIGEGKEAYIVMQVSASTEEAALAAVQDCLTRNNITITASKSNNLVKKAVEKDFDKKEEPIKKSEEIKEVALGDGWILKQKNVDNKIMMEVYDRDESTGQYIEMLPEDVTETERVTKYREILDLDSGTKENIKEEVKKMSNLTFKYITVAGQDASDSLERSFFTVKSADNKVKIVRAKYLLSQEEGDAIVSGKASIEPEEYCKKLAELHTDFDAFVKHASAQREEFKKQASVEVKAKEGSRFSQFSFNEKEITKEKQKEAGDKPVVSVDEKEAAAGKKDSAPAVAKGHGARIKSLYQRLPSNSNVGGEPKEAIDRKSKSLGEHTRILRQAVEKQRMLEAGIKDRDAKIALLAKEVEENKKEKVVDAKAEIISEITSNLKDSENLEKVKEQLMDLDENSLKALKTVLDLMNEKEEEGKLKDEELNAEAGIDFDQVPALELGEEAPAAGESMSLEDLANSWGQDTLNRMQQ